MNRKSVIIVISALIIVIALVLTYFIISSRNETEDVPNLVSEDLELSGEEYIPSKVYGEEEQELSLSNFADKPMLLIFWNTTSEDATKIMDDAEEYYNAYKDKVNFVGIAVTDNVTETKETIKQYVTTNNITIPIVYDTDYSAKNEYKIESIPTIVCVNKNKEVINTLGEGLTKDALEANLDILAENY